MEPSGYLHLVDPSRLDPKSPVESPVVRRAAERFLNVAPPTSSSDEPYEQQLAELGCTLIELRRSLEDFCADLAAGPSHHEFNEKQAAYDAHFHVVRVEANSADVHVAAMIRSFCKVFEDSQQGSSLLPLELAHLFAGAQLIVGLFLAHGEFEDEAQ